MLKDIRIQTSMKLRQLFRLAATIAVALTLSASSHAQDMKTWWLLRAPQLSSQSVLNLSGANFDIRHVPSTAMSSQSPTSANPGADSRPAPSIDPQPATTGGSNHGGEHRFWDTTNDLLFAGVGASRALDYSSTLNMRRRGRDEILLTNDVVDNHAAFAVIEAAGTGASIGLSYIFHHYGHHRLERATSIVHIGLATTGAVRNYFLKTAHPAPVAMPLSAMSAVVPAVALASPLR